MIIEIDGHKYPCKSEVSKTQYGNTLIRVYSEQAPLAHDGFKLYTDDESMIFDRTAFKYLYREDGDTKEYIAVPEEPVPVKALATGDIPEGPFASLSRQISAVNNRVTEITPYTETKKGYPNEIEKIFYNVPQGNLSIFFDKFDGEYTVERISDRVILTFKERLKDITTITIQVQ